MISFIMMAKNVEPYVEDAIKAIQKESNVDWELIIVEDHSEDKTYDVIKRKAAEDHRITAVKNKFKGKVLGTNYGYSLTTGDIIKCIDSDDILENDYFKEYETLRKYDAHCHSAKVVDDNLNVIGTYHINAEIINGSYEHVVTNLISLPKWTWSFKREIAEKIFPMPENLPFEDVWISILVKRNSKTFYNIKKPLYLYRQHDTQTFGGILNYDINRIVFRANRLLKLIQIIESEQAYLVEGIKSPFDKMKSYLLLQSRQASIGAILSANITLVSRVKLVLMMYYPKSAAMITKFKWFLDRTK